MTTFMSLHVGAKTGSFVIFIIVKATAITIENDNIETVTGLSYYLILYF